jgi:RNA polymerase sigma factor (sigma-70 family)
MGVGDTSIGGPGAEFPETVLDVVRLSGDAFARAYWKPVYHYFRVAWRKSNEDAKDLAQAFFLWLGDPAILKKYDPQRAAFRTFLKTLLRHFAQHHDEAMGRLKRGGGRTAVPLEGIDVPDEGTFERDWRRALIEDAVEDIRPRLDGLKLKIFEAYYMSGGRPTYDEVAAKFGLKAHDVQHTLAEVRSEIRSRLENDA